MWETMPCIHLGRRRSQKKASVTEKDGKRMEAPDLDN